MTSPFYKVADNTDTVFASDIDQFSDAFSGANDVGTISLFQPLTAPAAPTVAVNTTAGNLSGAYLYKIAFITGYWKGSIGSGTLITQGNTSGGTASASVSPASQQVNLSAIPTGPTGTVARMIYRTKAGGSTYYQVTQINDNTTTTYTDNTADTSLTVTMPASNTTGTTFSIGSFSVAPGGTVTATTAAADTTTTQLATTAFVINQASSTTPVMDGTAAIGVSKRYARADHVHPSDTSRAPTASPAFTGTPTSTTAAADTNTTQIATTAFVIAQAGSASPTMNGTAAVGTSLRYARQDHVHPTDTSRLAASAYTASDVLTKIKTVDGSGSGLDADTVDGYQASAFVLTAVTSETQPATGLVEGLTWYKASTNKSQMYLNGAFRDIGGGVVVSRTEYVTTPTSGTTHIVIGTTLTANDMMDVFVDGIKQYTGQQYNIYADNASIDLVGWSANGSEQFSFVVYKQVNADMSITDGSTITAGTVGENQLAPDIKVGSLATLVTAAKDTVTNALNEVSNKATYANYMTNPLYRLGL